MASFKHIGPGWYFVTNNEDGLYICEKLDMDYYPAELRCENGQAVRIPDHLHQLNRLQSEYSHSALVSGNFNALVRAAPADIKFKYDKFSSGIKVDAISSIALEQVIEEIRHAKGKILLKR